MKPNKIATALLVLLPCYTFPEWRVYEFTAYSHGCIMPKSGIESNKKNRTASGLRAVPNFTIAADKSIPFGTKVEVSYNGIVQIFEVHDRGRSIKKGRFDLFLESCPEARRFGRKRIFARIL